VNIHQANYDPTRSGGGWTFSRYFAEHFGQCSYGNADIYFITSASMVQRGDVQKAKAEGKKIILRVDNAIRNSRNRNTGMTRLHDFYEMADLVIYQSNWAKKFLEPYLNMLEPLKTKQTAVILNGVDTKKFYPQPVNNSDTYLYVRSSRDEGKQWIMAWYWFVNNPGLLRIIGKFSPENTEYNFDFYNNERFMFLGEQTDMAGFYRSSKYFLYTYLNDACSNTAIEALASGCEIIDVYGMAKTGGMPEIMAAWNKDPKLLDIETCMSNYRKELEKL